MRPRGGFGGYDERAIIRGKSRQENQVCGEGLSMTKEIPEDLSRKRCHITVTHFTSHLALHFLAFSARSSNSSVCLRQRARDVYVRDTSRTVSTRATLATLHGKLVGARDIRGSQFIFPADSSKKLPSLGMSSLFRTTRDEVLTRLRLKGTSHAVVQLFLSSLPIRIESYRKHRHSLKTIRLSKELEILFKVRYNCEIHGASIPSNLYVQSKLYKNFDTSDNIK